MDVVVITDGGSVDARLAADPRRHTLGDLAAAVLGHERTARVTVDGRALATTTSLLDADVRRGSVIDLVADTTGDAEHEHTASGPPRVVVLESAGFGGRRQITLGDGTYRIGPTRRINAPHLADGPVDDALLVVDVAADVVTVDAAPGFGASLDGDLLLGPTRWIDGPLVIDDRIFEVAPALPAAHDVVGLPRPQGTPTQLPIGRSLVPDEAAAAIALDATAGIGIVADPDDAIGILRSIVVAAALGDDHADGRPLAISIASDRPHAWEWAKWLPHVADGAIQPLDGPAIENDRLARGATSRLLVIDRTDPEALPVTLPTGCAIVAAAPSATMLPAQLGSIVEPVGTGRATAIRATTIVDGSPIEHRRIAPHTLDHDLAVDCARSIARSAFVPADPSATSPEQRAPEQLSITTWYVTRSATPTERRSLSVRPDDRAHVAIRSSRPLPASPHLVATAGTVDATRYLVPLGLWADRRSVATLPLLTGRRLAVLGPENDARSELLALMLDGIGHAEQRPDAAIQMFVLAPRGGAVVSPERRHRLALDVADEPRDVRAWLERMAEAPRPFVVVDGAERVGGPSMRWLASDDFRHATIVVAAAALPDADHWSSPWHGRWMTIELGADGETASVASRHRRREILLVRPDADIAPDVGDPVPVDVPIDTDTATTHGGATGVLR